MSAVMMTEFGTLPALRITAPDGAQAIVTLYGAHLVSWKSADGRERLFCSEKSALDGSRAIRGGVPVIFPQFAARGSGMRHGFARISTWRIAGSGEQDGAAFARFALAPQDLADAMAQAWPHAFALQFTVEVRANQLRLSLDIHNNGHEAFAFSSALHTYFLVDELANVRINGVQQGELTIGDKLDGIYRGIDGAITLDAGDSRLSLEQTGFTEAVVWNPGAQDSAALSDLGDGEYRRFVCIEPALVDPCTLAPGAAWRGAHGITAA